MHIVVRVQDEVRVSRFFELKFERFSRITYYIFLCYCYAKEQEATNRKTKQLHQQTQILIDKKLIVEANIEKHQIEFNQVKYSYTYNLLQFSNTPLKYTLQIAEHKRQLQNESNMLALDIDEAAKR